METFIVIMLVAALVFGICYAVDKAFHRLFRNKVQQKSGLSVRASKRYGSFGVILLVLGIAAVLTGLKIMLFGGGIVGVAGLWMIGYYLGFGVYYDQDSFVVTAFGKKSITYTYGDIQTQQLYNSSGVIVIELYMADKSVLQLSSNMEGVYPFLDYAFAAWCLERGITPESCAFHDPANSCWFPERSV